MMQTCKRPGREPGRLRSKAVHGCEDQMGVGAPKDVTPFYILGSLPSIQEIRAKLLPGVFTKVS